LSGYLVGPVKQSSAASVATAAPSTATFAAPVSAAVV